MPPTELSIPPESAAKETFGDPLPGAARSGALEAIVSGGPCRQAEEQQAVHAQSAAIRVLHVINGQHYAGAERVQDLLALRLPEFGFEVAFAAVKPGLFGVRRQSQKTPLYQTPMRNRLDLRPAWRLARIIRQEGYRLIHAHTPRTLLVGALAGWRAGVPLVYHVHSPAWADSTRWFFNWANAAVERWLIRRASAVICVSQALADQMRRRIGRKANIVVVPNGAPTPQSRWTPRILPSTLGSSSCGTHPPRRDPFTPTVGIAALFRPRKGIEVLLEALALLDRQDMPVRLRVVGPFESPAYESAVREKAIQLGLAGQVEWIGPVEQVEAQLAQMDLFVLPSLFGEGLPMVLLEAMAVGTPIIASQIDGMEEVVQDGQQGLLVPPGNPQVLAQAIAHLLTHPDQAVRLSENARQRYMERYSDRAMTAGAAEVYRRILADVLPAG